MSLVMFERKHEDILKDLLELEKKKFLFFSTNIYELFVVSPSFFFFLLKLRFFVIFTLTSFCATLLYFLWIFLANHHLYN